MPGEHAAAVDAAVAGYRAAYGSRRHRVKCAYEADEGRVASLRVKSLRCRFRDEAKACLRLGELRSGRTDREAVLELLGDFRGPVGDDFLDRRMGRLWSFYRKCRILQGVPGGRPF